MEAKVKSEFFQKIEAFAKEMQEEVSKNGGKRGIVILAGENMDGMTGQIISVSGKGEQVVKAIAEFATRSETKRLCEEGVKLGMMKRIFNDFEEMTKTDVNN